MYFALDFAKFVNIIVGYCEAECSNDRSNVQQYICRMPWIGWLARPVRLALIRPQPCKVGMGLLSPA
jgi:hypothetical protein